MMENRMPIRITPWTDERSTPSWLHNLLEIPELPMELRNDLLNAIKEVDELGAVNYPTKSRIEHLLHKYHEFLSDILSTSE